MLHNVIVTDYNYDIHPVVMNIDKDNIGDCKIAFQHYIDVVNVHCINNNVCVVFGHKNSLGNQIICIVNVNKELIDTIKYITGSLEIQSEDRRIINRLLGLLILYVDKE